MRFKHIQSYLMNLMLCLSAVILPLLSNAQDTGKVAMADQMRSDGKIYVVVTVIFTIFLGIILYLFTIEKKIKKIEQNQQ